MKKKYYHITTPEKALSILNQGLKCNEDGDIFLFENKTLIPKKEYQDLFKPIVVAEHIARNQIFISDVVMLEIDSRGIQGELIQDNVGEITSEFQWIAHQPIIEPKYIDLFTRFELR